MTQDTEDVVETVARAIYEARHPVREGGDWERWGQSTIWRDMARAALEASDRQSLSDRIDGLEGIVQFAYEEGVEDGIDWQRSPCGELQPHWIDSVARVELLKSRAALHQEGIGT